MGGTIETGITNATGMQPTSTAGDITYLAAAKCLGGFFFGLYSGIFALHVQIRASSKEAVTRKQNIVFHALWVLYMLSAAVIAIDIVTIIVFEFNNSIDVSMRYQLVIAQPAVFGFCDFIAQSILIYRCWVVWGCDIRVVIIPLILAFAYLVMWTAGSGTVSIRQSTVTMDNLKINGTHWGDTLALTGLTASMTVNALMTGLIVFRIFKVFHEVKSVTTSNETSLGITGGRKLRSIIFIIIESGMALFAIQLARLVVLSLLQLSTTAEIDTYQFIVSVHEMLNGITPTIILVRVSMGLSFHDEPSLVEAVGSLQLAPADHPNPIVGMGSLSEDGNLGIELDDLNANLGVTVSQERRDNDDGSDEIQMVDR